MNNLSMYNFLYDDVYPKSYETIMQQQQPIKYIIRK